MNRLLSAEAFRNRVGFSIKKGRFVLTHQEPKTPTFAAVEFTAKIMLTDLAGNTSDPIDLPPFAPLRLRASALIPTGERAVDRAGRGRAGWRCGSRGP